MAAAILAGGMAHRFGGIDKRALTSAGESILERRLCAIYARERAAAIRDRLDRGERYAAVLPGGVQVIEVGPEEIAAFDPHGLPFVNVNTPTDYAQARRRLDWCRPSTKAIGKPLDEDQDQHRLN